MINMIALEIKSYLSAYKEIIFFIFSGLIIGAVLYIAVSELAERGSLFEPFTVGVVDHDGRPELIFIYDFFNEYVIKLEFMEKPEALEKLAAAYIPAFIELPQNFTSDVFQGVNSPFTVHVSRGLPLQSSLVQLLSSGGIAFLSASQAGVYATLGYAADYGIPWADIQQNILIPVNLAFAQELIRYEEMFSREEIALVAGSPTDYFIKRFAVFWHMLSLLALTKYLRGYTGAIMARFKLAAVALWQVHLIKWSGLSAAMALISLPLMPLLGIGTALALSVFLSAFGLLIGKLFRQEGACALFIFFSALSLYFASGGIVPFAFLPRVLLPMRWLSINYWAANGNVAVILLIGIVIACFSFGYDLKTELG